MLEKYDTFAHRFFAGMIDGLVLMPLGLIDFFIYTKFYDSLLIIIPWMVISYSAFYIYSIYFHWKTGQTIGKKLMQVVVMDVSEEKGLSLKQSFMRDSVYVVLQCFGLIAILFNIVQIGYFSESGMEPYNTYLGYLGLIWFLIEIITMFTNKKRRAVHDMIANTVVIRVPKKGHT